MKLSLASAGSSEGQRTITNRKNDTHHSSPGRRSAEGPGSGRSPRLRPCRPLLRPPLLLQRLEQALRRQLAARAFPKPKKEPHSHRPRQQRRPNRHLGRHCGKT